MSTIQILITERFSEPELYELSQNKNFTVTRSKEYARPSETELAETEVLVIRSKTKITSSLLKKAPCLKLIVSTTSGFDHIDLNETQKKSILVTHTPEANTNSAAELTLALAFSAIKSLPLSKKSMKNGDWNRKPLLGFEVAKSTWGIIGLGRVGSLVAQKAQALGARIIFFDPYVSAQGSDLEKTDTLSDLMEKSQIVSAHVPQTDETNHMLQLSHLESLGPSGVFINTSRGSIVKEEILVSAIKDNLVRAIGLDVFEAEPFPASSELFDFPNIILSPHIGGNTREAAQRAAQIALEKIMTYSETKSIADTLPPKVEWYKSDK